MNGRTPSLPASAYLAAGLGSMIGGSLRWLVSDWLLALAGGGFPWGTLFANVTGSFAIGAYAARADGHGPHLRHFVMTGLCGGYTTFSIFSLESVTLLGSGEAVRAALYVSLSLLVWLLAVWCGYRLGRPAVPR